MDTISIILLALAGVGIIALFWTIGTYNTLVRLTTLVEEAWSGIDVQLKRRYDLIPNLVAVVKQYSFHEKTVLEDVTRLRNQSMNSTNVVAKSTAEGGLTHALHHLFAVAENYPQLKANENFLGLQKDLANIEQEIQLARRYYNGTVRNYNGSIIVFPASFIASLFGLHKKPYFELSNDQERENVKVQF